MSTTEEFTTAARAKYPTHPGAITRRIKSDVRSVFSTFMDCVIKAIDTGTSKPDFDDFYACYAYVLHTTPEIHHDRIATMLNKRIDEWMAFGHALAAQLEAKEAGQPVPDLLDLVDVKRYPSIKRFLETEKGAAVNRGEDL